MARTTASESRFVERDGVRIHYSVWGEGPALILLHGGGPGATGAQNFSRNAEALARSHTTYVIDFPGWGRSSKNLDSLGARSAFINGGRAIALFMDALSIPKAHLVGNSYGGAAAYNMAMDHPDRVDRIGAMGPGGAWLEGQGPTPGIIQLMTFYTGEGPTRAKLAAFLQNLVYDTSVLTDDFIDARFAAADDPEIAANAPLRAPPGGGPPPKQAFLTEDPRLAALPHRCLLVWGLEDKVNLVAGVQPFSVVPDQDVALFAKGGHWAQWEEADKFNELTNWFLDRP